MQFTEKCNCPSILIVDDDTFNLLSLEMLLNKLNYPCWKAFNGEEALYIFKDKMIENKCQLCDGIQLIFMDY